MDKDKEPYVIFDVIMGCAGVIIGLYLLSVGMVDKDLLLFSTGLGSVGVGIFSFKQAGQ